MPFESGIDTNKEFTSKPLTVTVEAPIAIDDIEGLREYITTLELDAFNEGHEEGELAGREKGADDAREELAHDVGSENLRHLSCAIYSRNWDEAAHLLTRLADEIGGDALNAVEMGQFDPVARKYWQNAA